MSAAAATADPVKKRGRPRKVVLEAADSEGALTSAPATAKSRKKKDVVGEGEEVEEVVVKKKAKSVKEGKTVAKSASASAGAKTTATTKAAGVKSKVGKEREKGGTTAKPAKGALEEGAAAKTRVAAQTPTPGATSSPILEEVFLTETMKRPAWGVRAPPGAAEKAAATATAIPTPKSLPTSRLSIPPHPSTSAPKFAPPIVQTTPPTPTIASAAATTKPTTPAPPSTPSAPSPPISPASAPPPPPSKHAPPPRITTIPLPLPPPPRAANPATPKPPPKPPTPQEIAQEAVEQVIRTGKLPDKYKPASRRITAIIVGIPIILVYGWYFVDKWKQEMHERYPDRFPAPKKKEPPVVKVVSY